uniref:Uncharacterized protein n=1 Tax=Arundo donax TaxID=35708 RepID=A0A0A9C3A2_ARUDO
MLDNSLIQILLVDDKQSRADL